ncbi:MAG: TAXI family TRAP transporter solute-binding subunit [Bacillota bacterium]
MIRTYFLFLCLVFWTIGCSHQDDHPTYSKDPTSDDYVTIATGGRYGPYFTIGSALAKVYSSHLNLNATVQTTGGSVENLRLLEQGKVDLAFVMSDVALFAYDGKEVFQEKHRDLRAISGLYLNYVQIVTLKNSEIHSVKDLAGKRVGVGAPNSGVEVNAKIILKGHGLGVNDYDPYFLSYNEAMEQLKIGEIDAAFVTSGLPNAPVAELSKVKEISVVPIHLNEMAEKEQLFSYFKAAKIPANTYGNEEPIPTIGIQNLLIVRKDLAENVVYKLTSTLYDNLSQLQKAHGAMKQVSSTPLTPVLPIPLHDGAKRYYEVESGPGSRR